MCAIHGSLKYITSFISHGQFVFGQHTSNTNTFPEDVRLNHSTVLLTRSTPRVSSSFEFGSLLLFFNEELTQKVFLRNLHITVVHILSGWFRRQHKSPYRIYTLIPILLKFFRVKHAFYLCDKSVYFKIMYIYASYSPPVVDHFISLN